MSSAREESVGVHNLKLTPHEDNFDFSGAVARDMDGLESTLISREAIEGPLLPLL